MKRILIFKQFHRTGRRLRSEGHGDRNNGVLGDELVFGFVCMRLRSKSCGKVTAETHLVGYCSPFGARCFSFCKLHKNLFLGMDLSARVQHQTQPRLAQQQERRASVRRPRRLERLALPTSVHCPVGICSQMHSDTGQCCAVAAAATAAARQGKRNNAPS